MVICSYSHQGLDLCSWQTAPCCWWIHCCCTVPACPRDSWAGTACLSILNVSFSTHPPALTLKKHSYRKYQLYSNVNSNQKGFCSDCFLIIGCTLKEIKWNDIEMYMMKTNQNSDMSMQQIKMSYLLTQIIEWSIPSIKSELKSKKHHCIWDLL